MLEAIARSKEPISSHQIKKYMKGSGSTYVYDMIEELVPIKRSIGKYLFDWDDLPGTLECRRKVFDKFDKMCDLNWLGRRKTYESREAERLQFELLKFEKSDDNRSLTISYNSNQINILLSSTKSNPNTANMIIRSESKKIETTFVTQQKYGKLRVYLSEYTRIPIRYLNTTLSEGGLKLISQIEHRIRNTEPDIQNDELKISPEVLRINDDRQYWRYSLNIRGFILYILGLVKTENKESDRNERQKGTNDKRKRGRKEGDVSYDTRRIDKTLGIISDSQFEAFPFLSNYRIFKELLPKNYLINIFKQTAEELQYQLNTTDIDFLKYWITRRCYIAITNYFGLLEKVPHLYVKDIDPETRIKLRDYKIQMLSYMVNYLSDEGKVCKNALEHYRTDQ